MDKLQVFASSPRWLQMGWGLEIHPWPTGPNLTLRVAYSITDRRSPSTAPQHIPASCSQYWGMIIKWCISLLTSLSSLSSKGTLWSFLVNKQLVFLTKTHCVCVSSSSSKHVECIFLRIKHLQRYFIHVWHVVMFRCHQLLIAVWFFGDKYEHVHG